MKNYKDINYKASIKANIGRVSKIMELQRSNPDLMYAKVRVDDDYDPNGTNFENYVLNGWDVVVDDCGIESDYAQNEKKENYKPVVLEQRGRGKAHFVWMSKSKKEFRKDELKRIEKDKSAFLKSAKGRKMTKKGKNLNINDPEVNEENYQQQSEED